MVESALQLELREAALRLVPQVVLQLMPQMVLQLMLQVGMPRMELRLMLQMELRLMPQLVLRLVPQLAPKLMPQRVLRLMPRLLVLRRWLAACRTQLGRRGGRRLLLRWLVRCWQWARRPYRRWSKRRWPVLQSGLQLMPQCVLQLGLQSELQLTQPGRRADRRLHLCWRLI